VNFPKTIPGGDLGIFIRELSLVDSNARLCHDYYVDANGIVRQELTAKTKDYTAVYTRDGAEWKLCTVTSNHVFSAWETIGETLINVDAINKLELYKDDDKDTT
jgi:hypothetical protein